VTKIRQAIQIRVPVTCPLCGLDVAILAQEIEEGYDLPPVLMDVGGRDVMMTEHVNSRISGLVLTCNCLIPHPPWILVFPAPGVPPYFRKEDE
jgi:hypothetical protein